MLRALGRPIYGVNPGDDPMRQAASNSLALSRPVLLVSAVCVLLVGATLALWMQYGTAVFFETIAAGFAACL